MRLDGQSFNMRDHLVLTFELWTDRLDDALLRWVRRSYPDIEGIEHALAEGPGFNLETLMRDHFSTEYGEGIKQLGPLSVALEYFGYWLFVGGGSPHVAHPPSFNLKAVSIVASRREMTYDGRRVLLSVRGGSDPILIPIPAVPQVLLPATGPRNFQRSRDALIDFAERCVDRVNVVAPAALHLGRLVAAGYPSGDIGD